MQIIGKDTIIESWVGENGELLHRTTAGFQFGTGRDRKIITEIEQVSMFQSNVQQLVSDWLGQNGVVQAQKHLMDREVAEQASEAPGTLDTLADKLGPEVKAQLFQMLKGAIHSKIETPPSPAQDPALAGTRTIVDGKPVVEDANGIRHVLPDPELVQHPHVIPTAGGVLLDKGNGHKEFVPSDELGDLAEEEALIAKQEGRAIPRRTGRRK